MSTKTRFRIRWADLITMLCTCALGSLFAVTMTSHLIDALASGR